jgi:dephospho-CoA kinase
VAEIPLLFEAGMEIDYQAIITVIADEKLCKQRFEKTKNISSKDDYEQRRKRQLNADEQAGRATYIIRNDGSMEDLKANVAKIYAILTPHTGV